MAAAHLEAVLRQVVEGVVESIVSGRLALRSLQPYPRGLLPAIKIVEQVQFFCQLSHELCEKRKTEKSLGDGNAQNKTVIASQSCKKFGNSFYPPPTQLRLFTQGSAESGNPRRVKFVTMACRPNLFVEI